MRMFVICAVVAGALLYYAFHRDAEYTVQGSAKGPRDLMAECVKRKQREMGTADMLTDIEKTCAARHGLRYINGDWR